MTQKNIIFAHERFERAQIVRRQLQDFYEDIKVEWVDIDLRPNELFDTSQMDPPTLVMAMATAKAEIAATCPDYEPINDSTFIIYGYHNLVLCDGKILTWPHSEEEIKQNFDLFRDHKVTFLNGLAVRAQQEGIGPLTIGMVDTIEVEQLRQKENYPMKEAFLSDGGIVIESCEGINRDLQERIKGINPDYNYSMYQIFYRNGFW